MSIALLHLVATVFMAGVIVFVQVVHYPLMAFVGPGGFKIYERAHTARTGWVVGPPMLLELGSALWLLAQPPAPPARTLALVGALLLAVIWASTALLQVPAHGRLTGGFDGPTHRRLVRTNWLRTAAWAARVPVAWLLVTTSLV